MKDINVNGSDWHAVQAYARGRIAALTADAISTSASDEERRNAAHRIEELKLLLAAPATEAARSRIVVAQPTPMY